ncbi:MAG: hypothetical protein ACLPKB_12050, partial [Xanthobacteraceae bacterium]
LSPQAGRGVVSVHQIHRSTLLVAGGGTNMNSIEPILLENEFQREETAVATMNVRIRRRG